MNGMIYGFLALWIASVGLVHAAPAASPSDRAYEAAQAAFKGKDYTRARTLAQEFSLVYAADSRVPSALLLKGMAELKNNQSAEARHTWQALASAHPKADAAALALEQLVALAEQKQQATESAALRQRLLANFPGHAVTVRLCARDAEAKAAQGAFAEAVVEYRKVETRLSIAQKKRLQELVVLQEQRQTTGGGLDRVKEQLTRAKQLVTLGNHVEAGKIFDKVAKQASTLPEGAEAQYWMGVCLAAQTNYTAAVARWVSLQNAKTFGQWREQALMEMARTQAFKLNEYDAAIATYRRFLEAFPKSDRRMEAEYQLAGVLYLKKDYPAAHAAFDKFVQSYPDSFYGAEAKKYRDKCGAFIAAAAKSAAVARKTELAKVAKTPPVKSAAAQLAAEADALFAKGDYKEAHERYKRLIIHHKTAPEYDRAALRDGQCLAAMETPQLALWTWQEFLKNKPQSALAAEVLMETGNLQLEELNQPQQAQMALEKIVTDYPQSLLVTQALHRVGLALFRQNQWDKAKEVFVTEQALHGGPNTNAPPTEVERLIAACDAKKSLTPDRKPGRDKLENQIATADLLFTAKEYAKAVHCYEKVVRTQPGSEPAAYSLMQAGRCYNQMRAPKKAVECYRPFLDSYRKSRWADAALIRLGVVYVGPLDDEKAGAEIYRILVQRYPNSEGAERAQYYLATLEYWGERWATALEEHQRFLRLYPKSDFVPYVLKVRMPDIEQHLKRKTR